MMSLRSLVRSPGPGERRGGVLGFGHRKEVDELLDENPRLGLWSTANVS